MSNEIKRTKSLTLLKALEKVNNTALISALTQINFLAYYAMLGVYAIINVMQLAKPFVGYTGQVAIASLLAFCAILNEYIDMSVVVEKESHDEYADDKNKQRIVAGKNLTKLGWYILFAATACLLGLCHYGLTTYNMIWIQLTQLKAGPIATALYYGVFVASAVLGALLTYTNSYLKYAKHVLLPGYFPKTESQETKKSQAKKPANKPVMTKRPTGIIGRIKGIMRDGILGFLHSTGRLLQATVNQYLTSSSMMFLGTAVGAMLYALGDFSQMYGLLFYVSVKNLFVLSPTWQLAISLTFAINTIFERSGIWGFNFKKYVGEYAAETRSVKEGYGHNGFAKLIIFDWNTRSALTNIRLACVFMLNIFGALLHFKGVYRFAGVATSLGYYVSQRTQNYFQTRKDAPQATPAVTAADLESGLKDEKELLVDHSEERELGRKATATIRANGGR